MSYILFLGANSDIAGALAELYAKEGFDLYLASKNKSEVTRLAKDLAIRYQIKVSAFVFDAAKIETHAAFYKKLPESPFGVVLAFGYLGEQKKAEQDLYEANRILQINFNGAVSILSIAANDLEQHAKGFIIGISSVAGDRGRASNYFYGSAKAGLTAFLSGLRNRLAKKGVHVITVKPGFVASKMTKHLTLPAKLLASPAEVAMDIFRAQKKKKNQIYTKKKWKWIMLIIRHIPEFIFKKLSL